MLQEIGRGFSDLIGTGSEELTLLQMALRALTIYITAIILGSVLSRAVTGNPPFLETIGAGAVLVGIHWLFSVVSYHSDWFGTLVKGSERTLIKDGQIPWDNMRKSHIRRKDLEMALHSNGQVEGVEDVKIARFERSGDISVIQREQEKGLHVVEVTVQDGVQTVRVELRKA